MSSSHNTLLKSQQELNQLKITCEMIFSHTSTRKSNTIHVVCAIFSSTQREEEEKNKKKVVAKNVIEVRYFVLSGYLACRCFLLTDSAL